MAGGVLSKYIQDQGERLGIPALAMARGVYTAAILGYVTHVAVYPALKGRKNNCKKQEKKKAIVSAADEEEEKEALMRATAAREEEEAELRAEGIKKGPEVNKEFFHRLKFLLR